jgi:N6-adenosine-specific RNA methylase IME4
MNKIPHGQYGVIYADPPWLYQMYSDKGHEKGAHKHYAGMTFEQLAALRDQILFSAGPDCVLFMWTTWAADPTTGIDHLQQAMDLMKIWGFSRFSGGVWNKTTRHGKQGFGTGFHFRSASEPFIIGRAGNPKPRNHATRNSLFTGEVPENLNDIGITISSLAREHSRKPDEMADLLRDLYDGPYLELFSRTKRRGWQVWGNETDKFEEQ